MDATTILTIIILLATTALLWTRTGGRQQQPNHDGQRASLGLSRREPSAEPLPRCRSSVIRHPPESGKSPQTHMRGTGAREGGDMNWTATFATRSLLAFCVGVLALSALPSSASSQQACGPCRNYPGIFTIAHKFGGAILPTNRCDNVGGCHYLSWWTNHCNNVHQQWSIFWPMLDDIESAIFRADHKTFTDALTSSPSWNYDPVKGVLSFLSSCSQYTVARYVLPESFAVIAVAMTEDNLDRRAFEKRVAQSEGT